MDWVDDLDGWMDRQKEGRKNRGGEEEGRMKEWNGKYKKEKEREWNQSGEGRGEVGGEGQKVRGPMQGRQRGLRRQLLPKKHRVICLPADHQPGSLPHP